MDEFDPTLRQLSAIQAAFDAENFSGADTPEGKRRHVLFHLGILFGKFARVEEQIDHRESDTTILQTDVIPDLLVYAAQLATIEGIDLATAYKARLGFVAERNGTGAGSATAAIRRETE